MIDWPVSQPTLSIDVASPRGTVVLRPLREDDIAAIFQACQDPTISAFTRVPFPYDREMAEDFVRGSELGYRNHQSVVFAIEVGGVFEMFLLEKGLPSRCVISAFCTNYFFENMQKF